MSVNAEVARIRTARDTLREKMLAAGYDVAESATIDTLVDMLELSKASDFELFAVNYTDRFITATGKYMVNIASAFKCIFYEYTVNRGKQYKLVTDKTYTYANLLMTDVLPEYDQTDLAVQDFTSGSVLTVNSKYLLVSLTLRTTTEIPSSALTITEI